jgi:hypothetical protein
LQPIEFVVQAALGVGEHGDSLGRDAKCDPVPGQAGAGSDQQNPIGLHGASSASNVFAGWTESTA